MKVEIILVDELSFSKHPEREDLIIYGSRFYTIHTPIMVVKYLWLQNAHMFSTNSVDSFISHFLLIFYGFH